MIGLRAQKEPLAAKVTGKDVVHDVVPASGRDNFIEGRGIVARLFTENSDRFVRDIILCDAKSMF